MEDQGSGWQKRFSSKRMTLDLIQFLLCSFFLFLITLPALELFLSTFVEQAYTPGYLVTHPTRYFSLKPKFEGKTYGVPFRINDDGFREEDAALPSEPDDFQIVFFGDSIAFGQGVKLAETFPKKVETLLNAKVQARSPRFQVSNLAVPGYSFATQVTYFKESYERFKPKLAVFEFSIKRQTVLVDKNLAASDLNQRPLIREMKDRLRNLYLYGFVANRFYSLKRSLEEKQSSASVSEFEKFSQYYRDDYAGWIKCKEAILDLAEFSKKNNVHVVFALIGGEGRVEKDPEKDLWTPLVSKLRTTLHDSGFDDVVLLDEGLRASVGSHHELQLRDDDDHYSLLSHRLAGEYLYRYLVEIQSHWMKGAKG